MQRSSDFVSSSFAQVLLSYMTERDLVNDALREELLLIVDKPSLPIVRFCELLEEIYRLDSVPALGLRMGKEAKPVHFGLVGYLVLSCNNLGQALTRYRRFQSLLQSGLQSTVVSSGTHLRLQWTQPIADTVLAHEFSLAAFVSLYQSLMAEPIAPLKVGLPNPAPQDATIYEAIMGCPVEFNSEQLYVEIPAYVMSKRLSSSDPYVRNLLEQQATAMLEPNQNPSSAQSNSALTDFHEQLQQHLLNAMKDGEISAKEIANRMGFSLRSFYRKLDDNGYTFRSILADARLRIAKQYLADLSLSHLDIALLLGYSEQSSFIRAFKTWMGITPGDYRQRLVDKKMAGQVA